MPGTIDVLVAQRIERSPPKRQAARSIRAEDVLVGDGSKSDRDLFF